MKFFKDLDNLSKIGFCYTMVICLFMIFSFIGQSILSIFLDKTQLAFLLINALFSVLAISVCIIINFTSQDQKLFDSLNVKKFNGKYLIFSLLFAVGMFFGLGFLNEKIARFLMEIGLKVSAFSYVPKDFLEFLLLAIFYALLPAVFEEIFFRRIILTKQKGSVFSICILNGLLFALYHLNVVQFFYQFIYGVILALISIKAKSVLPAIITHFINNFAILFFQYIKLEVDLKNIVSIIIGLILLIISLAFNLKKQDFESEKEKAKDKTGVILILMGVVLSILMMAMGL